MALAFRVYEMARQRARGEKRKNIMGTKVEKTMFVPQYLYIAKEAVHGLVKNATCSLPQRGKWNCCCRSKALPLPLGGKQSVVVDYVISVISRKRSYSYVMRNYFILSGNPVRSSNGFLPVEVTSYTTHLYCNANIERPSNFDALANSYLSDSLMGTK